MKSGVRISFLLTVLFLIKIGPIAAQAPAISYTTPQTYSVNTPIATLIPRNSGGAVPVMAYGEVTTLAGSGTQGSADGQGAAASFNQPRRLAIDKSGNLYVADVYNNVIRKITPAGLVTTLNITGSNFNGPDGITIDQLGNLYVANSGDNRIDEVTPAEINSAIAGNGSYGSQNGPGQTASFNDPVGICIDNANNVYVADYANQLIRKINSNYVVSTIAGSGTIGSNNGNGSAASFDYPNGVGTDNSGNVYVADGGNGLVRKIDPSGNVTTFAGASTGQQFGDPMDVIADPQNNIYVTDGVKDQIFKIDPSGVISVLAGSGIQGSSDGKGLAASFYGPVGLAYGSTGYIYIGDGFNNLIRKISIYGYTIDKPLPAGINFDQTTGIISGTPTGSSPPANYTITAYNAAGSSTTVVNIAVQAGSIVVPAPPNISYQSPQTYNLNTPIAPLGPVNTGGAIPMNTYGQVITIAGSTASGSLNAKGLAATFATPVGVICDPSGNVYVSEFGNNDIRKIDPAGNVTTYAGTGRQGANNGQAAQATFNTPYQLAIDPAGNLYVADVANNQIREISNSGIVTAFAGSGNAGRTDGPAATAEFNSPIGVALDPSGNMYVADRGNNSIRKIDVSGQVSTFVALNGGAPQSDETGLDFLTTDMSGNIFFANSYQVEKSSPAAAVTVVAGNGNPGYADGVGGAAFFNGLVGIAINPGGDSYVGDDANSRIRRIGADGTVTTVAGGPTPGASDGTGSGARFNAPNGVAIDATGNFLYVADAGNNLVRRVGITGYSIDKSLPTGLTFDPVTGIISGTPGVTTPPEVYTITAYNNGGSSSYPVTIQIVDDQTIVFPPLSPKTVCNADFDPGATSAAPITYSSSNPAVATIVSGKIHITGAGTSMIAANDGTSQVIQTLTVVAAITPAITITPASPDTCQGKTMVFSAEITGGGSQPVLQWQVNGQNQGTNSLQFSTSSLNNGDAVTCVLTSNAACTTSNTATSNIAVFTTDPFISTSVAITSSETGLVCEGTPITFTAIGYSPDFKPDYQWQVNGKNAGTDQSTFTSGTLANGDTVTCILTSTGKCLIDPQTTSNAITVAFSPQSQCIISIPNTFTPNGDGINDLWDINALGAYPGCTISIFSRDGALVYNSINYPKPWDGTRDGQKLPVGTYYYVIDLKNGKKPLAGSVTILR